MTPKEALLEARASYSPASGRGQALLVLAIEARHGLTPEQAVALRALVLEPFAVDDAGCIPDSEPDANDGLQQHQVDELAELGMVNLLAQAMASGVATSVDALVAPPAADAAPKKRGGK
jgi:hypothetical protein